MPQRRFLLIVSVGVLLLVLLPYLAAGQAGDGQWFGGFLINPIDGHSYLAKMQEGYRGEWKFTLPYTAEPGQGAFLFLFYLALGHLAKFFQLPLLIAFHGARLIGAAILIWAVSRLTGTIFREAKDRKISFVLILLGSGLGWIAILAGLFTSDFWVAEAFPFLSIYANPHFAIGLGLMIFSVLSSGKFSFFIKLGLGMAVSVIQPFGVVIVLLILLVDVVVWLVTERPSWEGLVKSERIQGLIGFGIGGGPFLVYQYWAIASDPVLAVWHSQNQTPTPSLLDLVLSLSPCLLLGFFGVKKAWQAAESRKLVIWAGICAILVFLPWSLQRRFLTGIYAPLAVMCVFGLDWLSAKSRLNRRFWTALVLVLSLPTNLIVIISGLQAAYQGDPQIYLDSAEVHSLGWIAKNAGESDLIVAEQDLGLLIPSATGRRVLYGHPFETIHASEELERIESFFYQEHPSAYYGDFLNERGADYVLLSENSAQGLREWLKGNWVMVFSDEGLEIYGRNVQ
jgi:hypothetical protein